MDESQSLLWPECYTELGFSFAAQTFPGRTNSVPSGTSARISRAAFAEVAFGLKTRIGSRFFLCHSSRIFIFLFRSLLALSLCVTNQLASQDSATGAIRGTVFDSSGSRVAQASIVVVNAANGTRFAASQRQRRTLRT